MCSCRPCFGDVKLMSSLLYNTKMWRYKPTLRSRSPPLGKTWRRKSLSLLKILSVHFLPFFFTFNPPSYLIQWADLLWLSLPFIHNLSDNTSRSLLHLSSLLSSSPPHIAPSFSFFFKSSEKERRLVTGIIKKKSMTHFTDSAASMGAVIVQARDSSTMVLGRQINSFIQTKTVIWKDNTTWACMW